VIELYANKLPLLFRVIHLGWSFNLLSPSRLLFQPPTDPLSFAINSVAPATTLTALAHYCSVFAALHLQITTRGTTEQSAVPLECILLSVSFLPSILPSFRPVVPCFVRATFSYAFPSVLSLCFCQSTRGTRLKRNIEGSIAGITG